MTGVPNALRGWWRCSQLRAWQIIAPLIIGAASAALAILVFKGWVILASFSLGYLIIAIVIGSLRAHRAHRHGC